jgi:hypothetical protein
VALKLYPPSSGLSMDELDVTILPTTRLDGLSEEVCHQLLNILAPQVPFRGARRLYSVPTPLSPRHRGFRLVALATNLSFIILHRICALAIIFASI